MTGKWRHSAAVTRVEKEFLIELDTLEMEAGKWCALVRLSKTDNVDAAPEHFILYRAFTDRAVTIAYTLSLMRICVEEFAPATVAEIASILRMLDGVDGAS